MKITLDASIKEHREIAELFRGSKIGHSKAVFKRIGPTAYLLGVDHIKGGFWSDEFLDRHPFRANKIIIDLDQAQMDLRMALGTGIKLKYLDEYGSDSWWAICDSDKMKFTLYSEINEGIDHKIKLCPDYLKLVGVEVE